jgi:hypothetical protein
MRKGGGHVDDGGADDDSPTVDLYSACFKSTRTPYDPVTRTGGANPQSIAGDTDFGCAIRLGLLPPTAMERLLLSEVRLTYGCVVKLTSTSGPPLGKGA